MTDKNVVFDTTISRFDIAIKEVEERVKLGWTVKASFLQGGGYLRVDFLRYDPNRYADVGKTNESKVDAEPALSDVGNTEAVVATTEEKVVEQKHKTTRKTSTKKTEVKEDE